MPNPPVPTERKRALGNPGKRKLPDKKTTVALPQVYEAPEHLTEIGRATWYAIKSSAPWVANTDGGLLLMLCEKMERRDTLLKQSQSEPFTVMSDTGMVRVNPVFNLLSDIEAEIVKIYSLLGLTPTDRTRLGVAEVRAQSTLEKLKASRG